MARDDRKIRGIRTPIKQNTFVGRISAGEGDAEMVPFSEIISSLGITLDDLTDVSVASPADGEVLTWVAANSQWEAAAGGAAGALDTLTDVNVPTPSDNDVLLWDNGTSMWINDANIPYASLQSMNTTRILGRDTAGTGVIEEITSAAILEWIGSTQGQILYRSAVGWQALPAGIAGYYLEANGGGANPAWAPFNIDLTADITGVLPIANGGTNAATAAAARTNLGLGTAAVEAIGTSGANVPLLSTANTWSGIQLNTAQPSMLAYNSVTDSNVTGDSTTYAIIFDTVIYDQNSDYNNATGIFTAPSTGKYLIEVTVALTGVGAAHTDAILRVVTSNRTYYLQRVNAAALSILGGGFVFNGSTLADMDAADTAFVDIDVANGTKVVGVTGSTNLFTYLSISLKD